MLLRLIYRALWWVVAPLAVVRLWWRGRFEPGYRRHIGERFGYYDTPPYTGRPLIWVHAVSVGETRAAQPLIDALLERYPSHGILLTHMTPTGRATGESLFGERVQRCYLPYDMVGSIRRFLKHWRPSVGVVMETEVWPNLIFTCRERGVPLVLTNARMSARSFRRAARFGDAARPVFGGFSRVFAQSDADAERLRMLGASDVDVMGNLNSRRGRVEGMEPVGNAQVIRAMVPLAEMFGYATDIRSMSQGRATFHMEFDHYEEVPQSIATELISAAGS